MRKYLLAVLLLAVTAVLGGTVLREPIASAAQAMDANIIGPLDGNGNVKVHEQKTASVHVTDRSVPVTPAGGSMAVQQGGQPVRIRIQPGVNYIVPSAPEKRLVIEYVNGVTFSGEHPCVYITSPGPDSTFCFVGSAIPDPPEPAVRQVSEPVMVVAEPGETLGAGGGVVTVYGYLLDA